MDLRTAVLEKNTPTAQSKQNKQPDRKQLLVEKRNGFAYTYMVNAKGQRVLLSKMPIEVSKDSATEPPILTDQTANHKRQLYTDAMIKRHSNTIVDFLNESFGVEKQKNR